MRGLGVLVAAAALTTLLVGRAAAQDGVGLPLGEVRFECDAWIDKPGLRTLLPLTRGEPVTAEQLAESKHVLETAGIFRSIDVQTVADDGHAVVTFALKRKRIITDVTVRGYEQLRWREVYRLVRLRSGSFYDPDVVEAARQRLLTRYQQIGFPHAQVTSTVRRHAGTATVRFTVVEGEPVTVAAAVVSGATGLPAAPLQRSLDTLVNRPQRRTAPRDGERLILQQLRAAGYYDAQNECEWVPLDADRVVLWCTVEAGDRSEIQIVGNAALSRSQLLGLMDLSTRLVVTDGTWRELARRMKRAYQERGYYRARVWLKLQEGDPRRITFRIEEGRRYAVRQLRFVGNERIASSTLRGQMNTLPARVLPWPRRGVFVREIFDEDLRRVWFFYRTQGFANAEVVDAPVAIDDDSGAVDVTVVIDEGPRAMVEAIHAPDLSGLPADKQALAFRLAPGAPLLPADLDADTQTIRRALRSDGYTDATVEPVVTSQSRGEVAPAVVDWTIVRGPRREVGTVIVQGNAETRNHIVLRELPFKTGDPLDPEVLQRGQDNIYQLGTYRSVAVRPVGPSEDDTQDVGVEVVPRPPGNVQWGAGYNTRDGITGFGEVSYGNLANSARRITLRGQGSVVPNDPSSTQFLTTLQYRDPQFLGSRWQWTAEVAGERSTRTIDQYSLEGGSVGSGWTRPLTRQVSVGAGVQAQYANVFDVQPQSFLSEDRGTSHTVSLSPFLLFDGRNDPFAPTKGVFQSVRLRYAPPGLSSVQFGKLNLQQSQAMPLTSWLSFITTVRVAYGRVFSGALVLPIQERYFLGGSTTVRGYAENSLGPVDQYGHVIGGDLAMVLSLEWRVPIIYQLSAAFFNDNGGLFLTQCNDQCRQSHDVFGNAFTWANFRHSVGPGLRYMTPVGPISLDYGFKLARRPGESVGAVNFSISGTF